LHGFPEEWVADGPPRLCERGHPLGAACSTCGELRQARKEWDKRRAQWKEDSRDRRKDIDGCRMCDRTGRVWIGGDPDSWWCDHGWGEPPLDSFGTVSSVPPDPEAVSEAVFDQPDTSDGGDSDGTEHWMAWMADSEGTEHS